MGYRFLEPLFDALPIGVIVLDRDGRVVVFNRHEEMLAGRKRDRVIGRRFFTEVAPCLDVQALAGAFHDKLDSGGLDETVEVDFSFPQSDRPRSVCCRLKSFTAEDGERCGMLLLEDVSMQRAVSQLKSTLAALLVHDLKSPLSVALANVDLAKRDVSRLENAPIRLRAELDAAKTAGMRLSAMIVDLLDIARMQTGTFPLSRSVVDASSLLGAAVEGQRPLAERRHQRLRVDVPEHLELEADASILRRVIDNLIDNAIRHSPSESTVSVRASLAGADMLIEVADEGPGVPAELRQRIFEPYTKALCDDFAGENRGLGLTFVELAARAHGGDIAVVPNEPTGARFRLRLPQHAPTSPSAFLV